MERLFLQQKAVSFCYIMKWPGPQSGFGLHQDLTVVDESRFRSVEVWCALHDTNEDNGQLWVVPGSHAWSDSLRGIHRFSPPYVGLERRIVERHAVPLPMKAGEAVIFNHATYHFSYPNRTDVPRLVAATDLMPIEADHLHYVADDDGRVRRYQIDEAFWVENNPFTLYEPPSRAVELGVVDFEFPRLTDQDLDRLVDEGRAVARPPSSLGDINPPEAWCHRCGTTEGVHGQPDALMGNVSLLCTSCEALERDLRSTRASL